MKSILSALLVALLACSAAAHAQSTQRIRGTITALEGNILSVKARDGTDLKLELAPNVSVGTAKALTLAELKPGDYVGSTAVKNDAGDLVAREVHMLPATAAPGHTPWDLEPGASMTNANVATVMQGAKGRELLLDYKTGSQRILVPEGTPIVTTVPADRSALVVGEYVFVTAQAAEGKITALRVQVSKNGVRPPQ